MSSSPSSSASPPPQPPPPPPPQSHSSSPSLLLLTAPESKPQSPPKKPPPLPWTHQETLALIQAYQEKWYSLKKGQLKAFQWEEVAVTVAARCGFDEPSKTSTQCRHKIEKLRKRYRSELQKPYPNSWQYFELMDQMERGPTSFNARPIAVVKSSPINTNSRSNNGNHGYASLYSSSADYYNNNRNNSRGDGDGDGDDGGGSDESDEEWNGGYNVEAASRNKSKSINNLVRVRGDVKNRVRSAKRVAMERGFSDSDRVARVLRNPINEKRKHYYNVDDSDDDGDGGDDDEEEEDEEEMEVEDEDEGEENRGGTELAAEIKGFAERFMRMENRKIEMMRETERYRMEMEKKRLDMILDAQRKIVDTISRGFGDHKKAKMTRES